MQPSWLFVCLVLWAGCGKDQALFERLPATQTGIAFKNDITESDSLSILSSEFIYNGGGLGVGDFNGDGLQDLYFTGNQVANKLYLNRGNFKFEDITEKANAQKGAKQWSAGVNVLDINVDGKLDLYICNTFWTQAERRRNLLLINQGNDAQGIPKFKELAREYGLADTTHSAQAQFFDYDQDGDLDAFIGVNEMDTKYPNQFMVKVTDGSSPNRDRLYRNDWNPTLNHPVFTDVSDAAGIKLPGYSHSSLVMDFNEDGWQDIYVANDYVTNDLIYINNQDGTFRNEVARIFKHQAASAMGSDLGDPNNDGRLDVITTEMLPYHNKRKKLFLSPNNYTVYINNEQYGYEYQYGRNTLQINQGLDPQTQLPIFSDVAFLSEVQETEWSWTPLFADLDNDGLQDLFVTNGFPRDVTDHDFGAYRSSVSYLVPPHELQAQIPQIKVPKFAFRNMGDLRFKDQSQAWGVDIPAFTNGAAYADLDNDGDLDLVTNNIDEEAFVFKNTLAEHSSPKPNHLRVKLKGSAQNPDAIGAKVTLYHKGQAQAAQVLAGRGYLSASEQILHFGLGVETEVDSIVVNWNGRVKTTFTKPAINQTLVYRFDPSKARPIPPRTAAKGPFSLVDAAGLGLDFIHEEVDYIDFNFQKTLPHKFSQYGPSLAIGDVNGDGLDDVYLAGSSTKEGTWLIQAANGRFNKQRVAYKTDPEKKEEELGSLLFDADGDGDLDLYLVRGGGQEAAGSGLYQDVLCVNDGKGKFKMMPQALPQETESGLAVKAADYDGDGDLDLFVGGNILPRTYPKSSRSFILRNDSKGKDEPLFTDVTSQILPDFAGLGIISDAIWTDFNQDGAVDLVIAGAWMPLTFYQNTGKGFENITPHTGLGAQTGWWTSLAAGDFDNDGDTDYIAGNYGENVYFKATPQEPLRVYAKDFDKNGLYDPFISCYWPNEKGERKAFFYHTRDDMVKQLILIRRKFQTYGALGEATVQQVFSPEELQGAQILEANTLQSVLVENQGNGKFRTQPLPVQAQFAPIFGLLPYDYDHDGRLDLLMVGNDYGVELLQGRADAFNGLVLKNLGGMKFRALSLQESQFYVPLEARALSRITLADQSERILATQNARPMQVLMPKPDGGKPMVWQKEELRAEITFTNGQKQRRERYWGSSFLSQEPNSLRWEPHMKEIRFFNRQNQVIRTATGNPMP